jgi:hypothetical protein
MMGGGCARKPPIRINPRFGIKPSGGNPKCTRTHHHRQAMKTIRESIIAATALADVAIVATDCVKN